ncbi:MAG: DUF4258 domain-containing protein [Chromatiales bacterium]
MTRRIIDRLRDKIRAGEYIVPFHAANELDDDEISIFDVESIILTGEIIERQRDAETQERKYVFRGETLDGEAACSVVKIGPTGKVVIITAWVEQDGDAV